MEYGLRAAMGRDAATTIIGRGRRAALLALSVLALTLGAGVRAGPQPDDDTFIMCSRKCALA